MSWICPHCGTTATLQSSDVENGHGAATIKTARDNDGIRLDWTAIRCPGKSCGKFVLEVAAHFGNMKKKHYGDGNPYRSGEVDADKSRPVGIGKCLFEPRIGIPLSSCVPIFVKNDYEEAHLIKDLSPKASATLCRRALQGMIRDFRGVVKPTLHEELAAIKPLCDVELFEAMMGLKSVGNIGAHPEKDINLIIDVEEGEATALLELIRILDKDWYVARAARSSRLAAVKALGVAKVSAKTPTAMALPAPPSAP